MSSLKTVTLTLDEYEALRLSDLEGMYQEQAAGEMEISRQTFGNLIGSAHQKVADCLVNGKAIIIEGGTYIMEGKRTFHCADCDHEWQVNYGTPRPENCPECESQNIHRAAHDGGPHNPCCRQRRHHKGTGGRGRHRMAGRAGGGKK